MQLKESTIISKYHEILSLKRYLLRHDFILRLHHLLLDIFIIDVSQILKTYAAYTFVMEVSNHYNIVNDVILLELLFDLQTTYAYANFETILRKYTNSLLLITGKFLHLKLTETESLNFLNLLIRFHQR